MRTPPAFSLQTTHRIFICVYNLTHIFLYEPPSHLTAVRIGCVRKKIIEKKNRKTKKKNESPTNEQWGAGALEVNIRSVANQQWQTWMPNTIWCCLFHLRLLVNSPPAPIITSAWCTTNGELCVDLAVCGCVWCDDACVCVCVCLSTSQATMFKRTNCRSTPTALCNKVNNGDCHPPMYIITLRLRCYVRLLLTVVATSITPPPNNWIRTRAWRTVMMCLALDSVIQYLS